MNNRRRALKLIAARLLLVLVCALLPVETAAQQGGTTRYLYDDNGRLRAVISPTGEANVYEYDPAGNFTEIKKLAADTLALLDFSPRAGVPGDPVTIVGTGFSAGVSSVTFNGVNARIISTNAPAVVVEVPQGATSGKLTITTPRGAVTTAETFTVGGIRVVPPTTTLVSGETLAFSATVAMEYDPEGNVLKTVDRLGRSTFIEYDDLNRRKQVRYVDATVGYRYDAAGRLLRIDDTQSGAIEWAYDDANRRLSEKTPAGVVSYKYNPASQRIEMTAADRPPVTYAYDSAGRLRTITQTSEVFTYAYDKLSRMESLNRPNRVKTEYRYDAVNRLERLAHTNAAGVALEDFRYTYNADDEIASINSLASATLIAAPKTATQADANRIPQFGAGSYGFDSEGQTIAKTET